MLDLKSRTATLTRSLSLLISLSSTPSSLATASIPLTLKHSSVSQPIAAASATIIFFGSAFFTSRITARTTSGFVQTDVSGGSAWPAFGFRTTVEPLRTTFWTPPIKSKTRVTFAWISSLLANATKDFFVIIIFPPQLYFLFITLY